MRQLLMTALCAALLSVLPGRANAASSTSPAKVTLHLSVTGALVRTVTLSHPVVPNRFDYGCLAVTGAAALGNPGLTIAYNTTPLSNFKYSHPAFSLVVNGYSRSKSRYGDPSRISVGLALQGHGYAGEGQNDRKFTATVTVQNGGRAGIFRATHLVGPHHSLVTVTGTWRCDTMQ